MNPEENLKGLEQIHSIYRKLFGHVDLEKPSFEIATCFIVFNPTFWNIVARLEYRTHFLSRITGSARRGCYTLAATIFLLGVGRDVCFKRALDEQPISPVLNDKVIAITGRFFVFLGQVLVVTSLARLGITGTYLGDYFGILMENIVTDFPFNISNNPMYQGSTLTFIGFSLIEAKVGGLVLSLIVYFMYFFALKFEEPFTATIYAKRDGKKMHLKKKRE